MKEKKRDFEFWYLLFIGITGLLVLIYGLFLTRQPIDYKALIRENIPDVSNVEKVIGTKTVFKAETPNGTYYAAVDSEVGYQSKIEVLTIVNEEGLLERVLVTQEAETPSFFERLYTANLFERFDNLSLQEPIYVGLAPRYSGYRGDVVTDNYVDVISGSTISSHAVTAAVNKSTQYLAQHYFNGSWDNPYDIFQFDAMILGLIVLYLVALAAVWIKKLAKLRFWFLLASIVLVGFMINQFVTPSLLLSLLQLEIPSITNIKWYVLVGGSLGFIILVGKNLYCAWICPFGALQECLHKITGFKSPKISQSVIKKLKLIPPTLLWIAILLGTWLGNYATLNYQPFEAFFLFKASWVMWLMLPVLLIVSLFYSRFFCQFFCPVGFVYNLMNRWRNRGVRTWKKWMGLQGLLWKNLRNQKSETKSE